MEEFLKKFHGENYTEKAWNSKQYPCCVLCKTKSTIGRSIHWAAGLCRSCYRRLSATHRLYNDRWNGEIDEPSGSNIEGSSAKKQYKYLNPADIKFNQKDISSLLERYNFQCAYCRSDIQNYDHKKNDAFQIEYRQLEDTSFELVPVCRGCNCSKKNLSNIEKLKRWAYQRGVKFPFEYVPYNKEGE